MVEVVREVTLHAPGWIEHVPGEFPGHCIVRLDAQNQVVEVVPLNAPASDIDEVQEADEAEASQGQEQQPVSNVDVERMGG